MSIRAIVTVCVAAALLLTGVGGATVAGLDAPETAEEHAPNAAQTNATIHVTSSTERSAPPDAATVRFAVTATAPTADDARRRVAENVTGVRAALREAGVADDDVRTAYYDIGPVYGDDRSTVDGYRAIHAFAVDIEADADDLGNRTGAVADTVVRNGADQIQGVTFSLAEETRQDLRQEALERAMNGADRDAETLAAASGLTVAGVQSISTADTDVRPIGASFRQEDAAETVIEPGDVTVSATVSVTYRTD